MMRQKGFTLLELMVTIAILAILFSMAVPSYQRMQARNVVRNATNQWQSSFYFAQSEAMRLKKTVTLCPSADGDQCQNTDNFTDGWIVVSNNDDAKKRMVLRSVVPTKSNGLTMTIKNIKKIEIDGRGRIDSFGAAGRKLVVTVSKPEFKRTLTINSEGSIRGGKS